MKPLHIILGIFKNLNNQLISLVILVSMFMLLVGHFYFKQQKEETKKEKYNELRAIAQLKSNQLAQWHQERLSEVNFFSCSLPYTQYAKNMIEKKSKEETLFRNALARIMSDKRYENIYLLDEKGQLVFSVIPDFIFEDTTTIAYSKKAFRTGTIIVRDFYFCNIHQDVHYQFIAPIADENKRIIASLVFSVNPDNYLYPLIQQEPTPGKTAETVLVRQERDTVWYLNDLRHLPNAALQIGFSLNQTEKPAVRAVLGQTGFFEGPDYAGCMVIGDISRIPNSPWYLIVKVNTNEIYSELNKRAILVIIIDFLFLFFIGTSITSLYHYRQKNIYKELLANSSALYQSGKEFGAILYSIGDGVITTDNEGLVKHINHVAEKLTGWNDLEANGKNIDEVFRIINEETREKVGNPVEKVMREGTTVGLANHTLLVSREGPETPISDSGAPIKDDQGNLLGVVLVFSDQTEERKQQKALKESEERYRLIMENNMDAVILSKPDGSIISINRAACEMFHMSENEIYTAGRDKMVEMDDNFNELQKKLYNNHCVRGEITCIRKDGTHFPTEVSGFIFYDGKGDLFIAVILNDITERKMAEDALRESEKNYRELIDGMNETAWVIDLEGNLIDVNRTAIELLGYTKEEFLEIGLSGIDSSLKKEAIIKRVQTMPHDRLQIFETTHQSKDGRVLPVEIYSSIITYRGQKAILSIARDISRRKEMEEQRRLDEDIQQVLYEIAKEFMSSKSLEDLLSIVRSELSKLLDTNNFYVAMYHPETDILKKIFFVNEKFDLDEWGAENSLSGQIIKSGKTILLKGDHITRYAVAHEIDIQDDKLAQCWLGVPLIDDQNVIGVVVVQSYTDENAYGEKSARLLETIAHQLTIVIQREQMIRDLITAKEKAEESDRLQSAFLANMSHEIRTPMNGILGFLSLLNEPDLEETSKKEYIEIVNKSGERLLNTINDIIEISKIEAGESKVTYSEVNIMDVMQFHQDFFRMQTDKKGLRLIIEKQVTGSAALVCTDRTKLDSILGNLIKNAIKFTKYGVIELGNYIEKDSLVFYVKDTGEGISSDRMEAIFERFVQANLNLNRAYEGSGLGLSIAKAYINALGGTIRVQSEVGKGSTFIFSIPYKPVVKRVELADQRIPVPERHSTRMTILIAEDDDASYQLLSLLLAKEEVIIIHTTNGQDTIRTLKENPEISLILMDIKMPDMDGLEATRQIRAFNQIIPIIAQTAHALPDDEMKTKAAGCNEYISKPIRRRDLIDLIEKYATDRNNKA